MICGGAGMIGVGNSSNFILEHIHRTMKFMFSRELSELPAKSYSQVSNGAVNHTTVLDAELECSDGAAAQWSSSAYLTAKKDCTTYEMPFCYNHDLYYLQSTSCTELVPDFSDNSNATVTSGIRLLASDKSDFLKSAGSTTGTDKSQYSVTQLNALSFAIQTLLGMSGYIPADFGITGSCYH